jgi:predicted TPR repeat methyltransferase
MNDTNTALAQVYAAKTPAALTSAYQLWAQSYDRETLELGYCLPFVIASWLARYVKRDAEQILDAGCGTGLSGPLLGALGYLNVHGIDMSPNMLEAAKRRGGYSRLVEAELGKALPFADGSFEAFICTGVFTAGHAPASSLYDLARVLAKGGHGIFTIRDSVFESGGFGAVLDQLVQQGLWQHIETSPPFRAFTIAEPEVLVRAFVFQKA